MFEISNPSMWKWCSVNEIGVVPEVVGQLCLLAKLLEHALVQLLAQAGHTFFYLLP